MLCEVVSLCSVFIFSLCSVRFLVLDLARLRLASWLASLAGACLGGPRYIATNPPGGVGTGGTNPPLGGSMPILTLVHSKVSRLI